MTIGFVVSFGGVLVVFALLLIWEAILKRHDAKTQRGAQVDKSLDALLADAESASQRAQRDIAEARARLVP